MTKCQISKIKSIIKTCIDTCNINYMYNISINDVIDAVMHSKSAKSDGNEGLIILFIKNVRSTQLSMTSF